MRRTCHSLVVKTLSQVKIRAQRSAAVLGMVTLLASCMYRTGFNEYPGARSATWFSYASAQDIRTRCAPGGRDVYRVIYNGNWQEQVRTYDFGPSATGAGGFIDEPHAAIEGRPAAGEIVNLTDHRAASARGEVVDLGRGGPEGVVSGLSRLRMPAHHDVRAEDIDLKRLGKTIAAVADRGPEDFAELMLVPGVGARTLFALALVAEVVHGAPSRFADPARFSLAHGGKDGHPFPVPLKVYDETIRVLKDAVGRAKLGEGERLAAIRRLDNQARAVEGVAAVTEGEFAAGVEREWAAKPALGGRTVADDRKQRQLVLPF